MKKIMNHKNPYLVAIVVILASLGLYYYGIINELNWLTKLLPEYFNGIATLLVGIFAFTLYKQQQDDVKKDAANILLLEIQNAESVLKSADKSLDRTDGRTPVLPYDAICMPVESWSRKKYLFVSDLDNSQWEAINNFYNLCKRFDFAVRINGSYFDKDAEQHRSIIHNKSSEIAWNGIARYEQATTIEEKNSIKKTIILDIDKWTSLYLSVAAVYSPKKHVNDATNYIRMMKLDLSLPSALDKLKGLGN